MSTINNMNLPNTTTRTHTLNSSSIYKCFLSLHPSFQTSSGQFQIAISTLHQDMDVPQSLAAPDLQNWKTSNSNHLCICFSRKSNFSPKSTNTLLNPFQIFSLLAEWLDLCLPCLHHKDCLYLICVWRTACCFTWNCPRKETDSMHSQSQANLGRELS